MSLKFFKKEIVSNPFMVKGAPVQFEVLNGNVGVLMLDDSNPADKPIVEALNEAAAKRRGGVVVINEETFEDIKKKQVYVPSRRQLPQNEKLRVMPRDISPWAKKESAAGEDKPEAKKEFPSYDEWLAAGFPADKYPGTGPAPQEPEKNFVPSSFPKSDHIGRQTKPEAESEEKAPADPNSGPAPALTPKTAKLPDPEADAQLGLDQRPQVVAEPAKPIIPEAPKAPESPKSEQPKAERAPRQPRSEKPAAEKPADKPAEQPAKTDETPTQ